MSSPFKTQFDRARPPETPEALFRQLRPSNKQVRDLLSRQADVLRAYSQLPTDTPDVALELPTGAGKTLVGFLLAEFRRRSTLEPVAYLCPTRQLARQAIEKANEYGIEVADLIGSSTRWSPSDRNQYQRGTRVAVATYSALFNTNPKLGGGTLVMDDAHAGESYVAETWSVTAPLGTPLYDSLLSALGEGLPASFVDRLKNASGDPHLRHSVRLVSPLVVARNSGLIRDALAAHADSRDDPNFWSAQMLIDAVEHCMAYVSGGEILLRPMIVPTAHHKPFSDASQRIYMSATLGAGGEIERAFGVESMARLTSASASHQQGLGRRFFVLPGASVDTAEADEIITAAIERAGRGVVLALSNREIGDFETNCAPEGFTILRAGDVEDTFDTFTTVDKGLLLLANRFDGIDLPDESCRLIVLTGLPTYSHGQERFFYDHLLAERVVSERIRTRIVQGAGRCTRNARDYAVVLLRGSDLIDFVSREEQLSALHPELQAEVRFGLLNAESDDIGDLLDHFLNQDGIWQMADHAIQEQIEQTERRASPGEDALQKAAAYEVAAWSLIWRGDYRAAIANALQVIDALEGGDELRGYRVLWLYLLACWSTLNGEAERGREFLREAERASMKLPWVPRFEQDADDAPGADFSERALAAARQLRKLGMRGSRFEKHAANVVKQLCQTDAAQFEVGLRELGLLLGFESERPPGSANPDGAWRDGDLQWFIFEAKTDEKAENPVSAWEVRQSLTHADWVRANLLWAEPRFSVTCLITPKTAVLPEASDIARDLIMVAPEVLVALAEGVVDAYRDVRVKGPTASDEELASLMHQEFGRRQLGTPSLLARLASCRIARV